MLEKETNDVMRTIFENASIKSEDIMEKISSIEILMRYYRDDIPNKPRCLYDADAVFFYNFDDSIKEKSKKERRDLAERGDIMTSLWAPLTYYLKLNSNNIIGKNNANIDKILELRDTNERCMSIFNMLEFLADNYASRGNLLLLPNTCNFFNKRNLNPDKFIIAEDKLDKFLYECFDGRLAVYFKNNNKNLIEWIRSEHLECMFSTSFFENLFEDKNNLKIKDEDINSCNLQSMIGDQKRIASYNYAQLNDEEWEEYFKRLKKIIRYRNSQKFNSHLPFKW